MILRLDELIFFLFTLIGIENFIDWFYDWYVL